jgi:diaminopimelate decarboxylase
MSDANKILVELMKHHDFQVSEQGELVIGGCNTMHLANMYNTPVHIVDEEGLESTAKAFRETMQSKYPGIISVHYAFKCNPVPGIIKIIKNTGIRAEVMSEYELTLALKLGYPGNEIIVNGPYKTDKLLTACLKNNIRLINVDSLFELERINSLCISLDKCTDVLLRINPDIVPAGMNRGSSTASRTGSPFGLDLIGGEVRSALEMIKIMKRIRFRGFHFHIGSGIQNTDDFRKTLKKLRYVLNDAEKAGFSVEILDIGGGLGIPDSREMTTIELLLYQAFDLVPSLKSLNTKISFAHYADSVTKGVLSLFGMKKLPELILEPGRCITGPNQVLLLKIHQVKVRKGLKKWLIADAGIGTLTMPTYYELHHVLLCTDIMRKTSEKVTIGGPGCFSADVVYRNIKMPEITAGEIIAILDSGAYFTSWESSFGFPRPSVVSVNNGRHSLLRERESFEHMMSLDTF